MYPKFPIVMCICAHGIVIYCYNGISLISEVCTVTLAQTQVLQGYASTLRLGTPKFAMYRRCCLSYEYGAGMLFTTHSHDVGLTKLPPWIQKLSWKA